MPKGGPHPHPRPFEVGDAASTAAVASSPHARVVLKREPLNAEASPESLREAVTPEGAHFVRTNFSTPVLDGRTPLMMGGAVVAARAWNAESLLAAGTRTLTVTLECAGNGRLGMNPLPSGEPWQTGAVSVAAWTGTPLRHVLEASVLRDDVREILVEGWDEGDVHGKAMPFARSLPLEKALDPDTLLAIGMNGGPIPATHGGPVRLIVPGWYGVASVKWVRQITALTAPYEGYFQGERYVYQDVEGRVLAPVQGMRVKSLLTTPEEGATVPSSGARVEGWAWSGEGAITRVQVDVDGHGHWSEAVLEKATSRYAWTRFSLVLPELASGRHTLRTRAFDAAGNEQPEAPVWNRLGYGNNSVSVRVIHVR